VQQIRLPKIGHGFDVHKIAPKFDESKPLKLGGVEIADRITLEAHSDGDVVLHAVCDALLGAIGEGDIGEHFPDSDPKYKNICSSALLSYVSDMVNKKRLDVGNLDITIVAETPRMHVYKHGIRENISKALKINLGAVNVKATTTEGLGSIGRKEGIGCHVVVLLHPLT
jgi:2-C-methyl-D-erythritol 2,4-cyclodiphosphate synthase